MTDIEALKAQISDEADLCWNEGATDIAALLDDARYAIKTQAREIERLRGALALKDQYFKGITKLAALGETSAALAGDSHDQ